MRRRSSRRGIPQFSPTSIRFDPGVVEDDDLPATDFGWHADRVAIPVIEAGRQICFVAGLFGSGTRLPTSIIQAAFHRPNKGVFGGLQRVRADCLYKVWASAKMRSSKKRETLRIINDRGRHLAKRDAARHTTDESDRTSTSTRSLNSVLARRGACPRRGTPL
jgi:hypothetical protein